MAQLRHAELRHAGRGIRLHWSSRPAPHRLAGCVVAAAADGKDADLDGLMNGHISDESESSVRVQQCARKRDVAGLQS